MAALSSASRKRHTEEPEAPDSKRTRQQETKGDGKTEEKPTERVEEKKKRPIPCAYHKHWWSQACIDCMGLKSTRSCGHVSVLASCAVCVTTYRFKPMGGLAAKRIHQYTPMAAVVGSLVAEYLGATWAGTPHKTPREEGQVRCPTCDRALEKGSADPEDTPCPECRRCMNCCKRSIECTTCWGCIKKEEPRKLRYVVANTVMCESCRNVGHVSCDSCRDSWGCSWERELVASREMCEACHSCAGHCYCSTCRGCLRDNWASGECSECAQCIYCCLCVAVVCPCGRCSQVVARVPIGKQEKKRPCCWSCKLHCGCCQSYGDRGDPTSDFCDDFASCPTCLRCTKCCVCWRCVKCQGRGTRDQFVPGPGSCVACHSSC
jgi:hypothetical protein